MATRWVGSSPLWMAVFSIGCAYPEVGFADAESPPDAVAGDAFAADADEDATVTPPDSSTPDALDGGDSGPVATDTGGGAKDTSPPPCVSKSCGALGFECGSHTDNCGKPIGCGGCGSGWSCSSSGKCSCGSGKTCGSTCCGSSSDSCTLAGTCCGTTLCGGTCCPSGATCTSSGACCTGKVCGSACCKSTDECVGSTCCSTGVVCGGKCCTAGAWCGTTGRCCTVCELGCTPC